MDEQILWETVEQAGRRLAALRVHLEAQAPVPEVAGALTDLQALLEALHTRCLLLRALLDQTSGAVFAKGLDGRYELINPRGAELFGRPAADIVGQDDTALFGREDAERIMTIDREVMDSGRPRTLRETVGLDGSARTFLTTRTTWRDEGGKLRGLIGTSNEVAERTRTEQDSGLREDRLRAMASEIVMAEEGLRRSLAMDLQNGLSQDIALARMRLARLRQSAGAELHDPLKGIEQLIEQADHSARSITFQISPPPLHDLGLVPALEWLAEDVGGRTGLSVRIEDDGQCKAADDRVRVILFRAVRELLADIATRGATGEVVVRIWRDETLLHIDVEDGGGFDVFDVLEGDRLRQTRELLRSVGASMHTTSAFGRGARVSLTAPVETVHAAEV